MIKEINRTILISILSAVIYIVFGIIMIINPHIAIEVVSISLGIIVGVIGIASIIKFIIEKKKYNFTGFGFAGGIISLIIAFLLLFKYKELASLIPIILGILIIINGALKTEYVIGLKRAVSSNWLMLLILGIVEMILGIVLIFNPFSSSLAITQIIGIFVVIYSIVDIIECVMLKIEISKTKKEVEEVFKEIE